MTDSSPATLRKISPEEIPSINRNLLDKTTVDQAREIVNAVRDRGEPALRELAEKFGDVEPGAPLLVSRDEMKAAFESHSENDREMLRRTAMRIQTFADTQRASIQDIRVPIPGGEAGHTVTPVEIAGCYAPGGRFPLPSSVMMTAVTARAAGVDQVVVASPKPAKITMAAAYISNTDYLLRVGGAQGIAAMAYGVGGGPRCDVIVGPGNRWVTAAKKIVSGSQAGIDLLAGPSELVVYADDTADPAMVAADLLAQAEHDTDALPILVSADEAFIDRVNEELAQQLENLPTRSTAEPAVGNGFAVLAKDADAAIEAVNVLAPEHLEVICRDAEEVSNRMKHYGGLFVGAGAAEVLGDYGAGPNHTLPTGGSARFTGGLSVFQFLRIRTWMRIDRLQEARELVDDAMSLARHEGLEGHARSAEYRKVD